MLGRSGSGSGSGSGSPTIATRLRTAASPCGIVSLLCVLVCLALGIWLQILASIEAGSACEVPLQTFARVDGALYLLAAVLGAAAAVSFVWWAPPLVAGAWPPRAALAGGLFSICALSALALSWLGVKLWGTVLLFANALWMRMRSATALSPPPCAPALYDPLSALMIVAWTLPVLLLGLAALAALAWSLTEAYTVATGGGARERKRREEAEAEANPWLKFESTQANNPWERDLAHATLDDGPGFDADADSGAPPLRL